MITAVTIMVIAVTFFVVTTTMGLIAVAVHLNGRSRLQSQQAQRDIAELHTLVLAISALAQNERNSSTIANQISNVIDLYMQQVGKNRRLHGEDSSPSRSSIPVQQSSRPGN